MVDTYLADCYSVVGLIINMIERQEHLSEKDRKKKGDAQLVENIVPERSEVHIF